MNISHLRRKELAHHFSTITTKLLYTIHKCTPALKMIFWHFLTCGFIIHQHAHHHFIIQQLVWQKIKVTLICNWEQINVDESKKALSICVWAKCEESLFVNMLYIIQTNGEPKTKHYFTLHFLWMFFILSWLKTMCKKGKNLCSCSPRVAWK